MSGGWIALDLPNRLPFKVPRWEKLQGEAFDEAMKYCHENNVQGYKDMHDYLTAELSAATAAIEADRD